MKQPHSNLTKRDLLFPSGSRRERIRARRKSSPSLESLEPRVVLAANLLISEIMASNETVLQDQDKDPSDWLEISNPTGQTLELDGWHLTDEKDNPKKWQFPDIELEAGDTIVVFASGKDRDSADSELHTNFKLSRGGEYLALVADDGFTIVDEFDPFPEQYDDISYGPEQTSMSEILLDPTQASRLLLPNSAATDVSAAEWTATSFDDSGWQSTSAAIGYDQSPDDGDFTTLISADGDIESMRGQTASAYLRSAFTIPANAPSYNTLQLNMNYDDGFVAYLNGTEVASRAAPDSLTWDATATAEHGGTTASVEYDNFQDGDDRDDFTLVGDASWVDGRLQLTDSELNQTGAAWLTEPLELGSNYSFTASMKINAHSPAGGFDPDGLGGDGMTFVLQSGGNNRLGGSGGQLGLDGSGMTFVAIEFDTYNTGSFDPDDSLPSHIGINTSRDGNLARIPVTRFNGEPFIAGSPGPGVDTRYVWVDYDGPNQVMHVYFSDLDQRPDSPTLSANVDLSELFGGVTKLWTGFTAATGAAGNTHDVLDLKLFAGAGELGLETTSINISSSANLLTTGENVLAIHGLNLAADDEDFLIRPQLTATSNTFGDRKYFGRPTPGEINGAGEEIPPTGEVFFSNETKTFVSSFSLSLTSSGKEIRYTTNGAIPNDRSTLYTGPIRISSSTRIRARAFTPDKSPGPVRSESFVKIDSSLNSFEDGQPFTSNLPIMVFESFGGNIESQDRLLQPVAGIFIDPGEDGAASILDEPDFGGRGGMRIRGQSSQGFSKKQYALELWDELNSDTRPISASRADDKAASFFGLPAESDWVLNGPYSDKTQLNNYMTFLWSNNAGLYAPRARLVEVFVNQGGGSVSYRGDYRGTYVLLEKIKIDDNRVDIAEITPQDRSAPEITGGYIWKKDKPGAGDQPFTTSRNQELRMVDPDDSQITTTQKNWLRSHINEFEAALYGPNFTNPDVGYAKYIDVDSWAETWLLVEMTKNIDGFRLSTYYHKDRGGKIEQGPAWDFNLSLGNGNYLQGAYPEGWYHTGISSSQYPYWDRLFEDPNFEQRVIDRWQELRASVWSTESLLNDIDTAVNALSNGNPRLDRPLSSQPSNPISRNFDKWNNVASYQWPNCFFGQGSCPSSPLPGGGRPNEYGDYIYIMKDFVERRTEWIDEQFPAGPTMTPAGGAVTAPASVSLGVPNGQTAYYTTDGSDPRQPVVVGDELKLFSGGSSADILVPSNNNLINECDSLSLDTPTDCFMHPNYVLGTNGESWTRGRLGVGYDENTTYDPYIRTDVESEMNNANTSVYVRIPFDATAEQADANSLRLRMRYDDGFVAYLWHTALDTPVEIARANAPGNASQLPIDDLPYNARATGTHGDNTAVTFLDFDVSRSAKYVQEGKNYLIIQGLNANPSSSDFLIDAELVATSTDLELPENVYQYDRPITISENTEINARLFVDGQNTWTSLATEIFVTETPQIVMTEVNYHPHDPTAAELAQLPAATDDDFEFIELRNLSDATVNLVGSYFNAGIDFVFPNIDLTAGEHAVLVRNETAFRLRYGDSPRVLGEFTDGNLNNGGEQIELKDAADRLIVALDYQDGALWPQSADGLGASLQLADESSTPTDQLNKHYRWRGSVERGGSPGQAGAAEIGIVVNEILAHTDPPLTASDSIELYNASAESIDMGGWYLSDSGSELSKYQIPAGTILPPNNYLVFDEADFNPTPLTPAPNHFSLSGANGDDVWLTTLVNGQVSQFVDEVHFWATPNGESLGRTPNGSGRLGRMQQVTMGQTNSTPRVGPVLISEVQYQPDTPNLAAIVIDPTLTADDLEFIEISNTTGTPLELTNWRIRGGIDFDFTPQTTVAANGSIVLVAWDSAAPDNATRLAAFRAHYSLDESVAVIGGYRGKLSNLGERIAIQRPDSPPADAPNTIPRMLEDEVIYDNLQPWPNTAGNGLTLQRSVSGGYGNDAAAWVGAAPTPGQYQGDVEIRGDFNADGVVNNDDITLLCNEIQQANPDVRFDLTGDENVDLQDHRELIQGVLQTTEGDANLDRLFNSSDLVLVFQAGLYEDEKENNATWATGDWNCDGDFDSGDLVAAFQSGSYNAPAATGSSWITPASTDLILQANNEPVSKVELDPRSLLEFNETQLDLPLLDQESLFQDHDKLFELAADESWSELEI
ncbi:MAG: lamin tail domain-containing protein [Pirellulaceae bacterium]|nr:lamin tail domain-containing protein [Pirellulaceae bacterium]